MHIEVLRSDERSLALTLEAFAKTNDRGMASAAFLHFDCTEAANELARAASLCATQVHGATSCLGAMTNTGHTINQDGGGAAFLIFDEDGDFGTGCQPLGDDPRQAAQIAAKSALQSADRPGEAPELIWLSTSPGREEEVLQGIIDIVGEDVPIIGGSAADNSVAGNWYMFDKEHTFTDGILVTMLFPSTGISFAYQNGYAPTENSGVVTKTDGRQLLEIDSRPATEVYAEWTGGAFLKPVLDDDQNILADATLWPLGRDIGELSGVTQYLLAHPAGAHPSGALSLFADLEEGETITQMTGDVRALAERAGRVAALAQGNGITHKNAAGALMVYCGGCMLAVQDYMDDVVAGVSGALPSVPMLGTFTFGEQGRVQGAGNRHGNLMISCILFERGT